MKPKELQQLLKATFKLNLHSCDGIDGLFRHCYHTCKRHYTYSVGIWSERMGTWLYYGYMEWYEGNREWVLRRYNAPYIYAHEVRWGA